MPETSGAAVAAIGALFTGRNPGAPATLPWSVTLWGIDRHPVQAYEAIAFAAVAAYVLHLVRIGSRGGRPALTALLGYGLALWFVEAFRSTDVTATVLGSLRLGQVLGLALAITALLGLRYLSTRVKAVDPQAV